MKQVRVLEAGLSLEDRVEPHHIGDVVSLTDEQYARLPADAFGVAVADATAASSVIPVAVISMLTSHPVAVGADVYPGPFVIGNWVGDHGITVGVDGNTLHFPAGAWVTTHQINMTGLGADQNATVYVDNAPIYGQPYNGPGNFLNGGGPALSDLEVLTTPTDLLPNVQVTGGSTPGTLVGWTIVAMRVGDAPA